MCSTTESKPEVPDLHIEVKEYGTGTVAYEIEEVFCDVCGLHYDADEPCPFH